MNINTVYYLKVAAACFVVGACMELVMIKTGFYDIVTQTEAEHWEETRQQREERARKFREHLLQQAKQKGLQLPSDIKDQA
eukprot:jgi/Chrzof1/11668/Cz06g04130.t1